MQDAQKFFGNKKITIMGLGLLGRGVGDAKFLASTGADLIITDLKTADELAPSVAALAGFSNITFHLGDHHLEDFEDRDLIIRAPNAPLDSAFLAHARERGIPIEMDAALFVKMTTDAKIQDAETSEPIPTIVGITGTRGKSTTTHLIYEIARAACADEAAAATSAAPVADRNVHLGGNVRDTATLPLIETVGQHDIVVLELDSWQLQGFEEDKISPHIAVWTNFMPDHMNYYHGDMDRYFADKAAITRFQKPGDIFIAPREIKEKIEERFGSLAGTYIDPFAAGEDGKSPLRSDWEIALPGEHNRANAACAAAAARALGIPDEIIKTVLKKFHALPNRLELLGEKKGIAFYNDSNATTPDATIVALKALTETAATKDRRIILIGGGSDKELDFSGLAKQIEDLNVKKSLKKIILFEGKASEKLKALLPENISSAIAMTKEMSSAFETALAAAQPGDIIILSPAATSFGLFKNEYDRGEKFDALFQKLE